MDRILETFFIAQKRKARVPEKNNWDKKERKLFEFNRLFDIHLIRLFFRNDPLTSLFDTITKLTSSKHFKEFNTNFLRCFLPPPVLMFDASIPIIILYNLPSNSKYHIPVQR